MNAATALADSQAVGEAWVEHVRLDLRRDNRRVSGGWPGTMREARALTLAHFGALGPEDLERVVHAVYARARRLWLAEAKAADDAEE
ncbi:MAG TPA: hypothetical protein VGH87_10935 [Polyangiaceae bacterium]